ncbi:MAG: OB-fold nucleic acid binding domain-containing protein [Propioniciclava sp.]
MWSRIRRLFAPAVERASEQRQQLAAESGADAISEARDRTWVRLRGTIDLLSLQPRQDRPWLEAELTDGTGRVTIIWMGRDRIPGIEPGRNLWVQGRISCFEGSRRMYNPEYQLLPTPRPACRSRSGIGE